MCKINQKKADNRKKQKKNSTRDKKKHFPLEKSSSTKMI